MRIFFQAQGTLVEIAHDVLAERLWCHRAPGRRSHRPGSPTQPLDHRLLARLALGRIEDLVHLVQHQPALALGQRRTEATQLANDDLGGIGRIASSSGAMSTRCRRIRVRARCLRKRMPSPGLRRHLRSGRECRRPRSLVATDADHAEVRHQGGERIVGHLRLGRGHCADEGCSCRHSASQQADVGQHLQFQRGRAPRPACPEWSGAAPDWYWIWKRVLPRPCQPPCATISR